MFCNVKPSWFSNTDASAFINAEASLNIKIRKLLLCDSIKQINQ